jgi:cytochrome c553
MNKLGLGALMKKKILGIIVLFIASVSAQAADIEAGKAKSMVCAACHGQNGIAVIDGYPNLNGQNEKYMVSALKAYKAKSRSGGNAPIMQVQASILSDSDIENLSAYYASMK